MNFNLKLQNKHTAPFPADQEHAVQWIRALGRTGLEAAAYRIQSPTNRALVLYLLQVAIDNADDTCILEKARPLTDWQDMFTGSLVSMLSGTDWLSKVQGTVGQLHATRRQVNAFFAKFDIRA
jgi:hypothetical protein